MLVGDGRLDVDAPAAVPEWRGTDKEAITLLDLLEMRPGLRFVEDYVDDGVSHAWRCCSARATPTTPPTPRRCRSTIRPERCGTTRRARPTSSAASSARSSAAGATGMERFLRERLFEPCGMRPAEPRFDAAGTWVGSTYVYATARDFARFGELYRNDGVADSGERVLPAGWADHGRTFVAHDAEGAGRYGFDYGRHWWMWPEFPGSIAAHGYEGQYVVVVPDRQLTLVHLGKTDRDQQPPLVAALGDLIESFPVTGASAIAGVGVVDWPVPKRCAT